jgi:hypothetical protein
MSNQEAPVFCSEEHLNYLDDLRESGKTNMFGARPYLMREFSYLSAKDAGNILSYWMETFPRNKTSQQE